MFIYLCLRAKHAEERQVGKRGVLGKYCRKTYKTPSQKVSSVAVLVQSALMSKVIALGGETPSNGVRNTNVHKTAEAKQNLTQDI